LGFPGTTGLKTMDYYLADNMISPPGAFDNYFVEKLVQLPAATTFAVPEVNVSVVSCPASKNGYITFGSFNRTSKLTKETLDLWGKVLNEIPTSKMLIGNVSDRMLQSLLEYEFSRRGVVSDRLDFYPKKSIPDYLNLHGKVDLILDTFPYNGGTTTAFAIWMGVPILTYVYNSMPGRVGLFWLNSVGIANQFSAYTEEDFIKKAKYWSENVPELENLRPKLRERWQTGKKGKPESFAYGLTQALTVMWKRFLNGLPTESFSLGDEL
jgi:predicted O-linked N-acetylglucosamine transferase (SPINDLY family)